MPFKRGSEISLRLFPGGIRARLYLLLALVLLPMLLLLGWVYEERYQTRYAETLRAQMEVADWIATTVAVYLNDIRRSSYTVGEAISTFSPYTEAKAARLLGAVASTYPALRNLNWVSPAGQVLASSQREMVGRHLAEYPYFREILAGRPWSIGPLTRQGSIAAAPTFGVAIGLWQSDGKLGGVVVAEIDPEYLGDIALAQGRPGAGSFAIFDREGTLVYRHPEGDLPWPERVRWQEHDGLLRRALGTGKKQAGTVRSYRREEELAARVPIAALGWVAGAGQPLETALAPVRQRQIQDAGIAALITAASLLLAWVLGRNFTRPIVRLAQDVGAIGAGHLGPAADPAAPDEIRHLHLTVTAMATDLLLRAEALRESEERFRTTFEQAAVGMAHVALDGHFLRLNEKFCDIVGYSREELVRKSFMEITWPEDLEADLAQAASLLRGDIGYYQLEKRYIHKDGHLVWINLTGSLQRSSGGKPLFYIGVIEDISARKAIEEEMRRARDVAEEATRAKSEFLANTSHEIRTPMTVILAVLEYLSPTCFGPEEQKLMEMAENSAERLLTLIDEILDISRIEARKMELAEERFDLYACAEKAMHLFDLQAAEKGLRLRLDIDPRVPRAVVGDGDRLGQVLVNLVGNAIKFTERGGVTVTVEPNGETSAVRFSVQDTGIGIPADKLALVFESFRQADASSTRKHGGTGLGLAISQGLVELMGGTLEVTSREGEGSTFFFTVPLPSASAERAPRQLRQQAPAAGTTVLLAEDDVMVRELLKTALSQQGFRVLTASDGRQAVQLWEKEEVDLILMDVQMPQMDGLAATRRIRARETGSGRRVPIIAVTARSSREDEQACRGAGMSGYLTKPINMQRLFATINEAVDA